MALALQDDIASAGEGVLQCLHMHLTDAQRSKLCLLLEMAFRDVSVLAATGKPKQAADLANVFHKLPVGMWRVSFNLKRFRDRELALFFAKYRRARIWNRLPKYAALINEVLADQGGDFSKN